MALSGSVTTTSSDSRSVTLNWTASQSIENNASTISWNLKGSGSNSGWVVVSELRVTINGTQVYYRGSSNHTNCYNGTLLASGNNVVINHDSDGTKSFTIKVEAGIYQWGINCQGTQTFTLNTIPRASTFGTISGNTLGSPMEISINKYADAFKMKIYGKVNDSQYYQCHSTDYAQLNNGKFTFTPSIELCSYVNNSASGTLTLLMRTYNSSDVQVGSDVTKPVEINVPTSIVPSITNIQVTDGKGYESTYGGYIQGYSTVNVVVTASGNRGSTINSYYTTVNGDTYTSSSFETNEVKTSGTNTITAKVTDSRGRTATASSDINVLPYATPKITNLSVERCDADGTLNPSGSNIIISYAYTMTPLSKINRKYFSLQYKKPTDEDWTEILTAETQAGSGSNSRIVEADVGYSYDIMLSVGDSFTRDSPTTKQTSVPTAFRLFSVASNHKGIAFGKACENEDAYEFAMPILCKSNYTVADSTVIPDNSDFNSVISVGKYCVTSDESMATMSNSPDSYAGILVVESMLNEQQSLSQPSTHILQTFTSCYGVTHRRYANSNESGVITWGNWDGVPTVGNFTSQTISLTHTGSATRFYLLGTLPAGKYIVTCAVAFGTSATGYRWVSINDSQSDNNYNAVQVNPVSIANMKTYVQVTAIFDLATTKSIYVGLGQDSGSTLSTTVNTRYMRI